MLVQVLLELIEVQLIAILEPPVKFRLLLDGIVRQMHHGVLAVVQLVLEC
jgi:hypothetical protein